MRTVLAGLLTLGLTSCVSAASTDTIKLAREKVVELHISRADVKTEETKLRTGRVVNFERNYVCSGAFVTDNGYILTAKHCAQDVEEIDVTTSDGQQYQATITSISAVHDLALLHIDRSNTPYFKVAHAVYQGEKIFVMGSPLGITGTLTTGIIANLAGDVTLIDCGVLPGNSGGAAFNEDGELVGITTAGLIVFLGTTHLNIMQSIDAIIGFARTIK